MPKGVLNSSSSGFLLWFAHPAAASATVDSSIIFIVLIIVFGFLVSPCFGDGYSLPLRASSISAHGMWQ